MSEQTPAPPSPAPDPATPGLRQLSGIERNIIQAQVLEAVQTCYDPEIPVNIFELGLVYEIVVSEVGFVTVKMTLTTPHCPVAESMPGEVELRVLSVPGIRDAEVKLVWDPPWDPSKMSDEARLELGML